MNDTVFNPRVFEAAHQRLKTAPATLSDADLEQLWIFSPDLALQAMEQRTKALHRDPPVPRQASGGLDVEQIADTLVGIIVANITPMAAQIEQQEQRIAALEARPAVNYCGVHSAGTFYPEGSLTTRRGGLWHATKNTQDTPGADGSAWVLIVKRGQA